MQPYLFPYLGYFQLVHCADTFVIYDDANYIKRGFINRNSILQNGQPLRFTVPVLGASQNKLIKDLSFSNEIEKLLRTLVHAYKNAPYFDSVYPMLVGVLSSEPRSVASVCALGIREVFAYLGLKPNIVFSSGLDYDKTAPAEDKLIAICKVLGSTDYVNSIGGCHLYSKVSFSSKGCSLSFLKPREIAYSQGSNTFTPNLSIIDVLMRQSTDEVKALLNSYDLI